MVRSKLEQQNKKLSRITEHTDILHVKLSRTTKNNQKGEKILMILNYIYSYKMMKLWYVYKDFKNHL